MCHIHTHLKIMSMYTCESSAENIPLCSKSEKSTGANKIVKSKQTKAAEIVRLIAWSHCALRLLSSDASFLCAK